MGMLTLGERQKLAKLRRQMQKAPSPAEEFVSRMKKEVHKNDAHAKRIERGIVILLVVLLGIVLAWLWELPTISGILTRSFWSPRVF